MAAESRNGRDLTAGDPCLSPFLRLAFLRLAALLVPLAIVACDRTPSAPPDPAIPRGTALPPPGLTPAAPAKG